MAYRYLPIQEYISKSREGLVDAPRASLSPILQRVGKEVEEEAADVLDVPLGSITYHDVDPAADLLLVEFCCKLVTQVIGMGTIYG